MKRSLRWSFAIMPLCVSLSAAPDAPRNLIVAADSTAASTGDFSAGWGDQLQTLLDPAKVKVTNAARSNLGLVRFYTERWPSVKKTLRQHDVVLIQFGRHEGGGEGDAEATGALAGTGEEIKNLKSKTGQVVQVHTFGWYLRALASDCRMAGAVPVLLTATPRNTWEKGKLRVDPNVFDDLIKKTANEEKMICVDLGGQLVTAFRRLGPARVKTFYPADKNHMSSEGARLAATQVLEGLNNFDGVIPADALSAEAR